MQPGYAWSRFEERFHRTLLRTVAIALIVGAVFAVQQHRLQLLLPVALLGTMVFSGRALC